MSFNLDLNNYSQSQAKDFYDRLLERVRTLPGVEAASLGLSTPLGGHASQASVERVEGYQAGPREHPFGEFNIVASDYFRALGIPVLHGRDFVTGDTANGPPVVIVNEAFARRYWPEQNAVGKRIFQHGPNGGTATEVVGVVRTIANRQLSDPPRPALFFPLAQKPPGIRTLVVRTGLDAAASISRLRDVVKSLDPSVPGLDVRTLAQQKDGSLALQRMAATLLSGFGVLALLLAALGIYGVLAYSVGRRTREIGVRMALGAQVADVLGLVFRQGLVLVGVGLTLGIAGAFGAARLLRSFLYDVTPLDPVTFLVVIVIFGVVAFAACWLPARRATRVNPMAALRSD